MILLALLGCHGPPAARDDGTLPACSWTPNCVSSEAAPDARRYVAPLPLHGDPSDAAARLAEVVRSLPPAGEVSVEGDRILAELHTPSGWFTDDVSLVVDREAGLIHVRSASRVGLFDGGMNRRWVEAIRVAWERARR